LKFNTVTQKEWEATNEIEATLARQKAVAPLNSEKRLLCAEMIIICQFYRGILDPKDPEVEYDGHF
jgi:hypothetical protein